MRSTLIPSTCPTLTFTYQGHFRESCCACSKQHALQPPTYFVGASLHCDPVESCFGDPLSAWKLLTLSETDTLVFNTLRFVTCSPSLIHLNLSPFVRVRVSGGPPALEFVYHARTCWQASTIHPRDHPCLQVIDTKLLLTSFKLRRQSYGLKGALHQTVETHPAWTTP